MATHIETLTPLLPVDHIEPVLPFWHALGFEIAVQVPHDDRLGFVLLTDGRTQLMYQTFASIEADVAEFAAPARRGHSFLFVRVDDIDAVESAIADAPRCFARRRTFYGATEIGVREPGGHYVTFAQFADDGTGAASD